MSHLFDPDSPLMTALSALLDYFLLSFLALACSLPLVTVGPSFCALYSVMTDRMAGSGPGVFRGFFSHFRRCLRPALISWLIWLALAYFLYLELQVVGAMPEEVRVLFWAGALFLCFCLALVAVFLPPVIAADPARPLTRIWKAALVQSVGRLPRSLAALAPAAVPLAVLWYSPRWFWLLGLLWIFLWPALCGRLWAQLTARLLQPERFR